MAIVYNLELKRFEKEVLKITSESKIYYYDDDDMPRLPLGITEEELALLLKCNKFTIQVIEQLQEENYDYEIHEFFCEQVILNEYIENALEDEMEFSLHPNNYKWVSDCINYGLLRDQISTDRFFSMEETLKLEGILNNMLPKERIIESILNNTNIPVKMYQNH